MSDNTPTPEQPAPQQPTPEQPGGATAAPAASTDASLAGRESHGAPKPGRRGLLIAGAIVAAAAVVGGIVWGVNAASVGAGAGTGAGASPAASVDTSASIVVGLRLEPTSLDIRNTAGAALDQVLIDNVYEGLVGRAPDNSIVPSIATSWTTSDDGLRYTFTLNDGVTFSNGDALTAEDVVYSINDLIDNKRSDADKLDKLSAVTADDDTTVTITLSERDPNLLWALSGRAGLVVDKDASFSAETEAVGSGPFLLEGWKQGDNITLVRNDDYWGTPAPLAKVVFQYFADANAAINAATAGEVDVLTGSTGENRTQLEAIDGAHIAEGFASDKFTLAFNNAAAPLDDKRVREAIRSAIDHKAIIAAIGGGGVELAGPITSKDPGYEDLSALYPHDVAKAKELLADAGHADGLELSLTIPSFYGTTLTDLLTSQLADAGITLTVKPVEFSTWLSDVYTNKDYQLSIVDHAEARDFGNWADPEYYFGYDNQTVQDLYAQASTAASEDEQAELLKKAARLVSEDAAGDWLYNSTSIVLIRDDITGFPADSTSSRLDVTAVSAGH